MLGLVIAIDDGLIVNPLSPEATVTALPRTSIVEPPSLIVTESSRTVMSEAPIVIPISSAVTDTLGWPEERTEYSVVASFTMVSAVSEINPVGDLVIMDAAPAIELSVMLVSANAGVNP